MISEIFAKEFNNFHSRGHLLRIHELEPILERNLVLVEGRHWKTMRTCMQQFFTPAKLKVVMPALLDAQREFLNILGEGADSGVEVDIGSRCERFTFDVISKSGFNLDTQVQRSPDNPLFQKALRCFPGIMSGFMYSLALNLYHWPRVFKMLHKLFGYFFTNPLVEMTKYAAEIIKYRHQNPQVDVPDMAQLLLDDALGKSNSETKKNEVPQTNGVPLSQEKLYELSTNCMDVFLGGYDTARLALTYWFYLMGKHPDIQERMRSEVLEAFKKEGDELSVPTLTGLTYTNQVLSETLRMYPPIITFTTRCAGEDYRYGKYLIKKGTSVMVPTYQLHHDPLYWTDPEKFDPDRFGPENKHLIKPGVYQPFGLGIRVCIGQRLALLEMASVTSQVLRRFRITHGPSQKVAPLAIVGSGVQWLDGGRRSKNIRESRLRTRHGGGDHRNVHSVVHGLAGTNRNTTDFRDGEEGVNIGSSRDVNSSNIPAEVHSDSLYALKRSQEGRDRLLRGLPEGGLDAAPLGGADELAVSGRLGCREVVGTSGRHKGVSPDGSIGDRAGKPSGGTVLRTQLGRTS
ncbi:cytochrome P450 9e2 [Rhipicephalus sanguineus]|uniref:cytochrome P450 9e2 n=1 Tax=Rhipicephalus sanguineus TaxID=34632 RepID=UPI0020C3DCD4|nr:cytochrome P450 9e2 [Rhipicephalus sanguineus]